MENDRLVEKGHLFIFRSCGGDRMKLLTWDRNGYFLWHKRLEAGVFKIPRIGAGTGSIERYASELVMRLNGIYMGKLKQVVRYEQEPEATVAKQQISRTTRLIC